jgi:hypothetical protein
MSAPAKAAHLKGVAVTARPPQLRIEASARRGNRRAGVAVCVKALFHPLLLWHILTRSRGFYNRKRP